MSRGPARARLRPLVLVLVLVLLLPALGTAAPRLPAGPLATGSGAVARAQNCYAQGDLACTVAELRVRPASGDDDDAVAQRLLGFAAARLEQPDLARAAFAAWLRLEPGARLDAHTTLPVVHAAFVAALTETLRGQLDLRLQVAGRPALPLPPARYEDLPRMAPPPLSTRDRASDFGFRVGGTGAWSPRVGGPGVGLTVGVDLQPAPGWRVGLDGGAWQFSAQAFDAADTGTALAPFAALAGGYEVVGAGATSSGRGSHSVTLLGRAGGLLYNGRASNGSALGVGAGVRYDWRPPTAWLGGFVDGTGWWFSGGGPLVTVGLGVRLGPGRAAAEGR